MSDRELAREDKQPQHPASCKCFVGGLSWETTGDKLRSYFENWGVVREAFVSYNRANGRPRGEFDGSNAPWLCREAKHAAGGAGTYKW